MKPGMPASDVKPPTQLIEQPGNREALLLWHHVLLDGIRHSSYDLSARQMGLLLSIYLEPGPHTVRGLAGHMNVSKPAICRALDALSKEELIERRKDEADRRNVFIEPTQKGFTFLAGFSESILNRLMEIS
jgi:DNA-binding MarR family transcriptional regulator